MYAIVQIGSLQYKVTQGDTIDAQLMDEKEGASVTLENVLLFSDGKEVRVGRPYLTDVKVVASVVEHHKDDKVISFKFRRRKNSLWKKGHRQKLTSLNITKITA